MRSISHRLPILLACNAAFAIALTSACGGTASPTSPSTVPTGSVGLGITTYTFTNDVKSIVNSDCVSCHGSAQYPFVANLYPSPNMHFPEDGAQFLFFDPGSAPWAQWFQNRPGTMAMSGRQRSGIIAVDYDMMLTFALATANGSAGAETFRRPKVHGH